MLAGIAGIIGVILYGMSFWTFFGLLAIFLPPFIEIVAPSLVLIAVGAYLVSNNK